MKCIAVFLDTSSYDITLQATGFLRLIHQIWCKFVSVLRKIILSKESDSYLLNIKIDLLKTHGVIARLVNKNNSLDPWCCVISSDWSSRVFIPCAKIFDPPAYPVSTKLMSTLRPRLIAVAKMKTKNKKNTSGQKDGGTTKTW